MIIGLNANPSGASTLDDAAIRDGLRRGVMTGAESIHYGLAWDLLETSEGIYDLSGLQRVVDEIGSCRMSLTVAVIDWDGEKKVPAYLSASALDSTAVKDALNDLLTAIHAVVGLRPWVICLGQEVSVYLSGTASDITPFANLITSAKAHIQGLAGWSDVEVTASLPYDAVASYATYSAICDACTTEGWTYYFKSADYSFRDTDTGTLGSTFGEDLLDIFVANGVQPIILVELGCASTGTNATAALQAAFVEIVPAALAAYGSLVVGATYNWMSEFNDTLLDALGFTGDLRAWVGGLGLRDVSDDPKAAYSAWCDLFRPSEATARLRVQLDRMSGDRNTRLRVLLASYYGVSPSSDLSSLLARYQCGEVA